LENNPLFEISDNDLWGRIGTIETSKTTVLTPSFVPVVHPIKSKNLVDVSTFQTRFGVDLIITSSYILRKQFNDKPIDLAQQTDFQGLIMTDSGAYQSLVYGEIDASPKKVIEYQEQIKSDFGVPLDIPISLSDSYQIAKEKVETTIQRCKKLSELVKKQTINWVGPIQGGRFLDLLQKSATAVSQLPIFSMFALGSVVELMSNYQYTTLMNMILTVKQFLNPSKPLHLFGAGHPMVFPFIVAAGCDTFDSAAYALYADKERYLTPTQTLLLEDLQEFPCCCPVCLEFSPKEVNKLSTLERKKFLANHNLFVCQTEMKNIRRAINHGNLWELLERRSYAHPTLRKGFLQLTKYSQLLRKRTPATKQKGIFLFSDESYSRVEIINHQKDLEQLKLISSKKAILLSLFDTELTLQFQLYQLLKAYFGDNEKSYKDFDVLILDPYFGIIPLEITSSYPLIQYVGSYTLSSKFKKKQLLNSLKKIMKYSSLEEIFIIGSIKLFNSKEIIQLFQKQQLKIHSVGTKITDENYKQLPKLIKSLVF
jgi:7-cyano-7-deazaguanine tRNA-ribosyltransferase